MAPSPNLPQAMNAASFARLLLLAAIWGASFLFLRLSVPAFGAVWAVEIRILVAAACLMLAARWIGEPLHLGRHWRQYLVIGLCNSALPFLLFAYAAQSLGAGLLSILNSTSPLFAAIIGALWLRQPIRATTVLGLLLGLGGVAILAWDGFQGSGGHWLPLLAAALAPSSYAFASVYSRHHGRGITPLATTQGSMIFAALAVLPLALGQSTNASPGLEAWGALLALAVICTAWAYQLYFKLVHEVGPLGALSVTFLIPVFGVLWGVLLLGEKLGGHLLLGGSLVLLGTALANGLLKWPRLLRGR
ncbi:MAG TPA: DMT family transporter [Azospira sp.]|nr:DMT family transporter [Azospira sp.]